MFEKSKCTLPYRIRGRVSVPLWLYTDIKNDISNTCKDTLARCGESIEQISITRHHMHNM